MRSGEFVSDIFREIDDELRRENLLQLWSRYSRYIIAAAVVVALIAGGVFAGGKHLQAQRLAQAKRYTGGVGPARPSKGKDAAQLLAGAGGHRGGAGGA